LSRAFRYVFDDLLVFVCLSNKFIIFLLVK